MLMLVLALQAAPFDAEAAMDNYRRETRATIECGAHGVDDIMVCGLREADRYRVPLVTIDRDDPRHESVPAERARLIERPTNCEDMSAFLVGCGKAGVGVSSQRGLVMGGERPIAP